MYKWLKPHGQTILLMAEILHQLRSVVCPIFYSAFNFQVVQDFSHQQYEGDMPFFFSKGIFPYFRKFQVGEILFHLARYTVFMTLSIFVYLYFMSIYKFTPHEFL